MFDKEQGRAEFIQVWDWLLALIPASFMARLERHFEQALGHWFMRVCLGCAAVVGFFGVVMPIALLIYVYLSLKLFVYPLLTLFGKSAIDLFTRIGWANFPHAGAQASRPTKGASPHVQ